MMTMTANSRAQMAPAIGASIAMTVTPFIYWPVSGLTSVAATAPDIATAEGGDGAVIWSNAIILPQKIWLRN